MTDNTKKVALVTGGADGIGAASAQVMAEDGVYVYIADINVTAGKARAEDVGGAFVELDVSSEVAWAACVKQIITEQGQLDILVNSAGIEGDVKKGSLTDSTLEDWRRVLAVNLDGPFLGCREVLPHMIGRGHGSIVNIASMGSFYPTTTAVAYGASKAGLMQFTKSVAWEGSRGGARVRCNSVHPGMISTKLLARAFSGIAARGDLAASEAAVRSSDRMPLGAPGRPRDVGELVGFLASDRAAYITGSEFCVDGGWKITR